jgi:hypothetical protein
MLRFSLYHPTDDPQVAKKIQHLEKSMCRTWGAPFLRMHGLIQLMVEQHYGVF